MLPVLSLHCHEMPTSLNAIGVARPVTQLQNVIALDTAGIVADAAMQTLTAVAPTTYASKERIVRYTWDIPNLIEAFVHRWSTTDRLFRTLTRG